MKKISYLHTHQFTTNFTRESSYILGLLFADGYISKNTNEIRMSCLKEDMDIFESIFQTTGKWNRYNNYKKNKTRNNKPQGILICSDKQIRNLLFKSNDFLLSQIPNNLKNYWYRGYVDGDGCWTISQTSRILASRAKNYFHTRKFVCTAPIHQDWFFMENLLKDLMIPYKINKYSKSNNYSHLTITGFENYLKFGNYLYQNYSNDKIGLPRKYKKWKEIVNSYSNKLVSI